MKILFLNVLLILAFQTCYSQYVKGVVVDSNTQERLSFSSLKWLKAGIVFKSDENGVFKVKDSEIKNDTLQVSYIGYDKKFIPQDLLFKNDSIQIQLSVRSTSFEVTISAGLSYSRALLRKIESKKNINDLMNYHPIKYTHYNKIEADLNNINSQKLKHNPILKKANYILKNIDTTGDKDKIPIYLYEMISNIYSSPKPKQKIEHIIAARTKGIENKTIAAFAGSYYTEVDIYANNIELFNYEFVSPIKNDAYLYYNYFPLDTLIENNQRIFHIKFEPKRKGEPLLKGEMYVVDTVFAVKEFIAQIPDYININYITNTKIHQEFIQNQDGLWIKHKDNIELHVKQPLKLIKEDLIVKKSSIIQNIQILDSTTIATQIKVLNKNNNVVVDDSAFYKSDDFWKQNRALTLSDKEMLILKTLDRIDTDKYLGKITDLSYLFFTGYYKLKYIEIGQWLSAININPVQGRTFKIEYTSTPHLSTSNKFSGVFSYGLLNKQLKYRFTYKHIFNKSNWRELQFHFKNYYENGISIFEKPQYDPALGYMFKKPEIIWKFIDVTEYSGYYKHFVNNSLSFKLRAGFRQSEINRGLPTYYAIDSSKYYDNKLKNSEIGISIRYGYKERIVKYNYAFESYGSNYPVFEFSLAKGLPNILNSSIAYTKFSAQVNYERQITPYGIIKAFLFASKLNSNMPLPYTNLLIAPGNDFYFYLPQNFNLIKRFEFLSDKHIGLIFEHNLMRSLFDYLPIIRKIQLRQHYFAKAIVGSIATQNENYNFNKGFDFKSFNGKPYVEIGTGVNNILKFLRVDFVWRLSQTQSGFGKAAVFMSTEINL